MSSSYRDRVEAVPSRPGADEVELADYVWALWRYRLLIVCITLACGAVAFATALVSAKVYQATAVVTAAPPGGGELPYATIVQVRNLLQSAPVVERALARHPEATTGLTPGTFISKNLSIERNRDTNLWMVTVRLPEPQAAADTANVLSEEAVAAHRRNVDAQPSVPPSDPRQVDPLLVSKMGAMRGREASARQALIRFRGEARLEERRASLDVAARLPQELGALEADLSAERAGLAQVEAELRRQQEFIVLAPPENSSGRAEGQPRREFNPIHTALSTRVADGRSRIAALEQRRSTLKTLAANAARDGASVPALELQLADFQRAHQRALDTVTALELQLEQATEAAAKAPQAGLPMVLVSLTERAIPPASPIAPRPLRTLMLGLALGAFVSVIGALVLDALRVRPRPIAERVGAA